LVIDTGNTLTMVGMAATGLGSVIGCTWFLATKAKGIIDVVKSLRDSINHLSGQYANHVLESDNRDRDNQEAHTQFRTADAGQVEALKGLRHQLDRQERDITETNRLAVLLDKRVAVMESNGK
jgi:hypothetical protein